MNAQDHARFQSLYQRYLTELTLRGKSDKTIDLYARCLRQIREYFDTCPDQLGTDQLQQYFMYLVEHRSWSLVKIARNAEFLPVCTGAALGLRAHRQVPQGPGAAGCVIPAGGRRTHQPDPQAQLPSLLSDHLQSGVATQ